MKCKQVQSRLLEEAVPSTPASEIRAHLDQCAECLEWQKRLTAVEQCVPLLRVPASTAKARLMERIVEEPLPVELNDAPVILAVPTWTSVAARKRGWTANHKRAAWGVAAASIALLAFGAWLMQDPRNPADPSQAPLDPLFSQLFDVNEKLAAARTPGDSFCQLYEVANALQQQAREIAKDVALQDSPERQEVLVHLAERYRMTLQGSHQIKGVVQIARNLTPEDRQHFADPIMDRLSATASETDALAAQHPALADPLRTIAAAARQAEQQMRAVALRDRELRDVTARDNVPSPRGMMP